MTRVAVASALVIALATGVWLLWPDDEQPPSTTVPIAASSTTVPSTTSSSPGTTSTTNHVVDSVEEAETILRDLWFGWFEGIYNEDEDRIREVVIRDEQVADAVIQFGVMTIAKPPTRDGLSFDGTEILLTSETCLSVWAETRSDFREGAASGVHLFRYYHGDWKLFNFWLHRNDLWEEDCDALLS